MIRPQPVKPSKEKMPSYYKAWEFWAFAVITIAALIIAIMALVDVGTVYNVRCFSTSGINTMPVPLGYTGMVLGSVEFGVSKLQVNLQWMMPLSAGIPSAIIIRGPLEVGGVGALPIANPAVTICGSNNTNTCAALEAITCDEYNEAPGCGRLEVSITQLAPTDVPLTGQLPEIVGFLHRAKVYPQLFYVSVEHAGIESGRGPLGELCRVN